MDSLVNVLDVRSYNNQVLMAILFLLVWWQGMEHILSDNGVT